MAQLLPYERSLQQERHEWHQFIQVYDCHGYLVPHAVGVLACRVPLDFDPPLLLALGRCLDDRARTVAVLVAPTPVPAPHHPVPDQSHVPGVQGCADPPGGRHRRWGRRRHCRSSQRWRRRLPGHSGCGGVVAIVLGVVVYLGRGTKGGKVHLSGDTTRQGKLLPRQARCVAHKAGPMTSEQVLDFIIMMIFFGEEGHHIEACVHLEQRGELVDGLGHVHQRARLDGAGQMGR